MKIANSKKYGPVLIGTVALALASCPTQALDFGGFTTPTDGLCALDSVCALARGGVSDVMTLYAPDGGIFDQIFAFGHEEADNLYFFDPSGVVSVDPAMRSFYTTLLEPDGSISDVFGIANIEGPNLLGFISDPNSFPPSLPGLTFTEILGGPVPWILEPGSAGLTIEYDATAYLDTALRDRGFTASFQSDVDSAVPEPSTLGLLTLGAIAASLFKKSTASKA